jgi:hypothetical protein
LSEHIHKLTQKQLDYIGGWIYEEATTYKGETLYGEKGNMPDGLMDYDPESLALAVEKAVEAWNGGARDE